MGSQVVTLYKDKAKTDALYPRTKTSAISDDNNMTLSQIISELNNNLGLKLDLLWENASPTSAFGQQTISLDFSHYELILIYFNFSKNDHTKISALAKMLGTYSAIDKSGDNIVGRTFEIRINNIIYFDPAMYGYNTNNDYLIPSEIYGVK